MHPGQLFTLFQMSTKKTGVKIFPAKSYLISSDPKGQKDQKVRFLKKPFFPGRVGPSPSGQFGHGPGHKKGAIQAPAQALFLQKTLHDPPDQFFLTGREAENDALASVRTIFKRLSGPCLQKN